ncbi:winged helix DNA-binding domain-containing protein [Streptomyces radiopugnans]|uniref:winged helix DNA-binding domain-containing protein n=1 Tax=Streptomyces radiopugnans TaxID=403935 RepID=UPI000B86FD52
MPTHASPVPVLGRRALNRALLTRQLLLQKVGMTALEAMEHLVGLQAQSPKAPYVGLWTRLKDFRHDELSELLTSRRAVRIALMRGTVHLVSARDCLTLRPLLQPLFDRGVLPTYGRDLAGLEPREVADAGMALLADGPRSAAELGKLLRERWPDRSPSVLANVFRFAEALVQTPPRGVWGASGQPVYAHAEDWLGSPLDAGASPHSMVLRYLAAFGPATVQDIQTWSGLTQLREITEELRPRLRTARTEDGAELLDVPGAPLPDPDTPVPPLLVAEFDNLILSHADRSRVISDSARKAIYTKNAQIPGTFLVDGFVHGKWKITQQRRAATLTLTPFSPLRESDAEALTAAGAELLAFAADRAETFDVRIEQPPG